MNLPFGYPLDVLILRRQGPTFTKVKDFARVRTKDGADYYELKKAKMGRNQNALLKAADYQDILPGGLLVVFELNRGHFTPARIETRTKYDAQGNVKMKTLTTVLKNGKTQERQVEDFESVVIPVIDGNADIVHVENITALAKLTFTPSWLEENKWLIGLIVLGLVILGTAWLQSGATYADAAARITAAQEWARVANATLNICRPALPSGVVG